MLIELITPMILATAPVTLDVVPTTYDHVTQQAVAPDGQLIGTNTSTFNGTQTFDFQGRPSDSDGDRDQD